MHRSLVLSLAVAGAALVPVSAAVADAPSTPAAKVVKKRRCDSNYRGRCLRPDVSDYDCAGGSGNGPYYVSGPFRVVGTDHYGLDADHDGIACER
ncbi:excalibur domain-containing protein [Patulibacter sp. SYSU D01012]|uniref:excalibur domain-containing protein n=1 Tax=Patulibacter sp. SYSU D01012 TaxID=2817381 RepID=UPI001B30504C|nr:excalibur domain-containing protein [Patulibacter sp. SYSU D01012]